MNLPRKVYAIQHNVTKKIYIGSSKDPNKRYLSHMYMLRAGKHINEDMQADFDRFGENYSFYILDTITEFKDRAKEYEWMRKFNSHIRGIGYNYNDKEKEVLFYRSMPPQTDGLPQVEKSQMAQKLHALIDTLNDSQAAYSYTLLKKLFGARKQDEITVKG